MIEIIKLNKYFNRHKKNELHVIDNVNLKLDNKGLVALLGTSGSGKTTLLNVIGGLDKVKNGSVYLNNKKITTKVTYKKDKIRNISIGYIFQDYKLIDNLSVYDNVALVLKMIGIKDKTEIDNRVRFVLDKVGMYRYRNRFANMLSGGEKQRVAIARAIVKDPDIILADEPTGNLDSKNSIEVMNIIKAISREKLVILVTHERELANFYCDRIIEIEDGHIVSDKENVNIDDLNYGLDNTIYLKDIKNHDEYKNNLITVNTYNDDNKKINIDIVVKNGNIYIKSNTSNKIELVDEDSIIDMKDEHFTKIKEEEINKYEFDFDKVVNKNIEKKYASIFNIFTLITNGFKRIFDYSFLKKILLLGFFVAGTFIFYSVSSYYGSQVVKDEDFITVNRNYLTITTKKIDVDKYLEYEKNELVDYIMPGKSLVGFRMTNNDFYQTSSNQITIFGSLADIDKISDSDLLYGRIPENDYEIVIDKLLLDNYFTEKQNYQLKSIGIIDVPDMLNRDISIKHMKPFKIVGISNTPNPSIYMKRNQFINVLALSIGDSEWYQDEEYLDDNSIFDYNLFKEVLSITKGRLPENDYEVIINDNYKEEIKLNKQIDMKVNNHKLMVVGYYTSENNYNCYFVNNNTIKYDALNKTENMSVYPKDKDKVIKYFKDLKLNIKDSYEYSRKMYIKELEDRVNSQIFTAGIILAISLIEIYLMLRSSFLSRIKEIGILRAIGVKRADIYKMFLGEILAITILFNGSGILVMIYVLNQIMKSGVIQGTPFVVNGEVIIISFVLVLIFNIIVGLLPVFNTIRKTPAEILARHDIE